MTRTFKRLQWSFRWQLSIFYDSFYWCHLILNFYRLSNTPLNRSIESNDCRYYQSSLTGSKICDGGIFNNKYNSLRHNLAYTYMFASWRRCKWCPWYKLHMPSLANSQTSERLPNARTRQKCDGPGNHQRFAGRWTRTSWIAQWSIRSSNCTDGKISDSSL